MDALSSIAELIEQNDDFLVLAHVSPDGDTLGSALALARMLISMGKRAQCVCEDAVPHVYEFLPGASSVLRPEEARHARVAIAADCADAERLGSALPLFNAAQARVNIDHHATNRGYAQYNYVEKAGATGELIYRLFVRLNVRSDADAARCLYAALMSDTGCFAYSSTTPDTLRIAASLMESGADNAEINRRVYRTIPLHKQKLLGAALTKLALHAGGRVGLSCLSAGEISACGASGEDTEGIIDHIRDVEGVELAILIRESGPGAFKVSLRSKHYADVGAIAARMGGGGHARAAGYSAQGSMGEVAAATLRLAGDAIGA
ncbi:MAG TPA: bifunctional oligoribonuclease/PAP phosphatase NrnA [Clostridia bacterium]|nr:bifunctional oligoribonuclease/PAP phosphatase NrnA [Clostridia bacterium]